MKTILETLDSGTQWLEKKGVEDARRNMQLLLCHQLDCSKIQLYTRFDLPLTEDILIPLRVLLKRRGNREPLQHILGKVEFFRRDFYTDKRALIPRPETEELCEIILKSHPSAPANILDMGTGSGVIGITLALEFGAQSTVILADTSTDALDLANKNNTSLGSENASTLHTNLFDNLGGKTFDLIAANLPYVPERDRSSLASELDHDPDLALFSGNDGLDIIRKFILESPNFLNAGATIALEIGIHQHTEVERLLADRGFTHIKTHADICGVHRFPTATWQPDPQPANLPATPSE